MDLRRSLALGALVLLVCALLLCPRARVRRQPGWEMTPDSVVLAVGSTVSLTPFREDAGGTDPAAFDWRIKGEGRGAKISPQGVLLASASPAEFKVIAKHRQDGTVLEVPVRVMIGPEGRVEEQAPLQEGWERPQVLELASGYLLVTGGETNRWTRNGFWASPKTELYNPRTGRSTVLAPMNTPRQQHTALALRNGNALVVGGLDEAGRPVRLMEGLDLAFVSAGSTRQVYARPALCELGDGDVLVCGGEAFCTGERPSGPVAERLVWNGSTKVFEPKPLPAPPTIYTQALLLPSGKVFLAGKGATALFDPVAEVFKTLPWTEVKDIFPLPGGRVRLVKTGPSQVLDVNPEAGTVQRTVSAPDLLESPVQLLDGKLIWASALNPGEIRCFDPATGLQCLLARMNTPRHGTGALRLEDGSVLFMGGSGAGRSQVERLRVW